MMIELRKHYLYKYCQCLLKKECLNDVALIGLSEEDGEIICLEITRKTMRRTLIFGIFYWIAHLFFLSFIFRTREQNAFSKWYGDILDGVYQIMQGNWGSSMAGKRALVFQLFFQLLPIIIMMFIPILMFVLTTATLLLKRKIVKIR